MSRLMALSVAAALATACAPTVQVAAPKEPIRIDLNVKIEHEVRVRVEKDLDALIEEEKEIF